MEPVSAATDSNPPGELYCTTCEKTFHAGDRCPADGTRLLKLKARIDPFLGRDLDGRYTVLEKLGQGGMGAVYRAEQHSVGREVAVKVVNTSLVTDPEVIKRFLREAKLASKLAHPNAVAVLDFNQTDDGVFYLVMELVTGRTLDQVIRAERVFKPERVVRIGTQVLDALDGAHALSIVHRDLKPSNIMLLSQGRDLVKVLDFGLAKSVSPDATSTTMTGIGAVVGTPAFMPPELATGQRCDGRADLYSLGVILYLMGSGRLPFESESVHELVALHGSNDPAPPMKGVPHRLAQVIDRLLQKDPAKRYQTAAEALHALESSLSSASASADSAWPNDTHPSLGPFPARESQFAHLEAPSPPSLDAETSPVTTPTSDRRARSSTELHRMAAGETILAPSGSPVPPTSQVDLAPTKKKPWLLVGIAGAVVAGAVVFALARGGSSTPETTEPVVLPTKELEVKEPVAKEPVPEAPDAGLSAGGSADQAANGSATDEGSATTDEGSAAPTPGTAADTKKAKRDKKRDKRDVKTTVKGTGTTQQTTTATTPPPNNPPPNNPPPNNPPPNNPPPNNGAGSGSAKKTVPTPF